MTTVAKKVPTLPVPSNAANAAARVLAVASSQVGYHEGKTKSGDWNNDTVFGLWYGLNGNAWCAMFVSWCAAVAGSSYPTIIPKHAYTPEGFNWYASRGLADGRKPPNRKGVAATGKGKPRVGDVMYVYSSSLGRISHVGFVEKVLSNGYVQTLEGNTNLTGSASGDGVYRLKRQVTARLYFCHPQYAAVVSKTTTPVKPPTAKPTTDTPAKEGDNMTDYTPENLKTYAGQGVHGQKIGRSGVTIGQALDIIRKDTPAIRAALTSLNVQVTGLTAAVKALSEQQGVDPAQILTIVKNAADQALDDLKITLVAETDDDEASSPTS